MPAVKKFRCGGETEPTLALRSVGDIDPYRAKSPGMGALEVRGSLFPRRHRPSLLESPV